MQNTRNPEYTPNLPHPETRSSTFPLLHTLKPFTTLRNLFSAFILGGLHQLRRPMSAISMRCFRIIGPCLIKESENFNMEHPISTVLHYLVQRMQKWWLMPNMNHNGMAMNRIYLTYYGRLFPLMTSKTSKKSNSTMPHGQDARKLSKLPLAKAPGTEVSTGVEEVYKVAAHMSLNEFDITNVTVSRSSEKIQGM